ncbi:hypothetical protein MLD38_026113 [Melastoma candidum]|uniref:Uncharacterized protein n=1 Tax=Melastoma candidum TaxID=119954 RepID=A0ACB9NXA8_9MYRT|nr:hypothetical protein MLD38_026113 [Melastoma candidum]
MEASFPIKVTYQGTTLRFREPVDSDRNLVTDMDGLKGRIFSLFNIPPYSDVSISYVDDCDDMVNLVRDEDLHEAMSQNLECLKVMVGNSERVCSLYSTGRTSSAPL